MKKLSTWLYRNTKGWRILALLVLQVLIQATLLPRQAAKLAPTGPIDLLFFYTPDQAYRMVSAYGDALRAQYRTFELTVDIFYPIVYTLLLGFAISWLFNRTVDSDKTMRRMNVLPFGGWLFDLLENLAIVTMLTIYPSQPTWLAWAATLFTMVKWLFAVASLALLLYGIARLVRKALTRS